MAQMRWLLNTLGGEVVHPGAVLWRVFMVPTGTSQNELARRMGVPPRLVNQIVNGQRAITARTALLLADVYGGDGMDWLERQALWDLHQARRVMQRRRRGPNAAARRVADGELRRRAQVDRGRAQAAGQRAFAEFQARVRAWVEAGRQGPAPRLVE